MSTIWIVDDEESVREVIGEIVRDMGHRVRLFERPRELLDAYQPRAADAIITDVRMPEMDGAELTRELLKRDPAALVLIMTGYPSINDAVELIKMGAVDYLQKPIRAEEIRVRVDRALNGRDIVQRFRSNRSLTWILICTMPIWFLLGLFISRLMGGP